MVNRAISIAFLLSAIGLGLIAFPLFASIIEPNALYGFQGEVPLETDEWMELNRAMGAGAFSMACVLFAYHIMAIWKMSKISTGKYLGRALLALVLSLIPAYATMLLIQ